MSEQHLGVFLLQVFLLLALSRTAGELLRRFGHPPLVGEILVGLLLGPTVLGRAWPAVHATLFPPDQIQLAMLATVAWFGVLFLLLETGLEIDVSAAWRQRGPSLRVGIVGVIIPLVIGTALAYALPVRYMPNEAVRLTFALFLGTTVAISAMVIIARVLHDLELIKSDLGLVTLCGYAVNDLLAWVILSVVLGLATSEGVDAGGLVRVLLFSLVFTTFCLTWGLRWVDRAIAFVTRVLPEQPGVVLTLVCSLGLASGALTQKLGLTALFGFFLAGIMAGQSHALTERTRNVLSEMVHSVFVPLYFASIGLHYDFLGDFDWFIVAFVTVVSIGAKFIGAWVGVMGTDLSQEDRLSIAIAFTPSGVTGIVVADIALDVGILTTEVFIGIVVSTIVSSLLVAPWLSWSIRRRAAVNILSLFDRDATISNLASTDKWQALDELCRGLPLVTSAMSRDECAAAVREREELAGTAVGHEVAVPHARIPGLNKPVLVLGRSQRGIEWDSPDGLPVHLICLILTPKENTGIQLQILAALAHGLHPKPARERLMNAQSDDDVWAALRDALHSQRLTSPT